MKKSNVILIGLMGVGKSAIGRELADRLSMNFVDTDELIEEAEGMSVSEIFEKKGEGYFRGLESDLIREHAFQNSIIAVGGGMPVYNNNMDDLSMVGVRIYLKISEEKLSTRLWVVRKKRPLLKEMKTVDELIVFLRKQLQTREKFYEKADFVLDVNDKASCEIVEDLLTFVKNLN